MGIEKIVVYGINFVHGVILARLLCPEDFGLTAMLGIFIGLGGTLAESGLGTAMALWHQFDKEVAFVSKRFMGRRLKL